jgi:hypothetical protein
MGQYSTYLGVALQNILRVNKFKVANWITLGHGNYVNARNGWTYSHSDAAVNNEQGTLKFKDGDVVEMEFDTTEMVLRFHCNGQQDSLTVAPLQKGDCYRFVAYLSDLKNTVELMRSE